MNAVLLSSLLLNFSVFSAQLYASEIQTDTPVFVQTEDGASVESYGFQVDSGSPADVRQAKSFIQKDFAKAKTQFPNIKSFVIDLPDQVRRSILTIKNTSLKNKEVRNSIYISIARVTLNTTAQYYALTAYPNLPEKTRILASYGWIGAFCIFTATKNVQINNYISQGVYTSDIQDQNLPLDYRAPITKIVQYITSSFSKRAPTLFQPKTQHAVAHTIATTLGIDASSIGEESFQVIQRRLKKFMTELAPQYERFAHVETVFVAGIIVGLTHILNLPEYTGQVYTVSETSLSILASTVAQGSFDIGTGDYRRWASHHGIPDEVIRRNINLMGLISSLLSVTGAVLSSGQDPYWGNIMLGSLFVVGVGTQNFFRHHHLIKARIQSATYTAKLACQVLLMGAQNALTKFSR